MIWPRAPIKLHSPSAAMMYGELSDGLCAPPLLAFCNGNQRFVQRRRWHLWAHCLKSGISNGLLREALMSPKLGMSAFSPMLFLSSPPCHSALPNHPSTQQTCHPDCTPLQAASSRGPRRSRSLFDVYSRNRHTLSAGRQCDRAFHSFFTVSSVINSQVQNSNFLWH